MNFVMFFIWIHICGIICLYSLQNVQANLGCNQVSSSKYYITAKDFVVSRHDPKYVMCAAYFCSQSPAIMPLQLTVNFINYTADNIIVHLEKKSITFRNKCGNCLDDSSISPSSGTNRCLSCPKIEPSKGIEVHVRLDNTGNMNSESEVCNWDINFNMSIQELSCDEGYYSLNLPLESHCKVTFSTSTHLICTKPTCSQDIIFKNTSDKFIHKLVSNSEPQTCIWKIIANPHKKINLSFTPGIRKYLYIFEDNLLSPLLELGTCTNLINQSEITLEPVSNIVYIVYYSNGTLDNDAYIEITFNDSLCNLPTFFENGKVEIQQSETGTKAVFTCEEKYQLIGEEELYCNSNRELPVCAGIDKLTFDEPEVFKSNSSIIELDKGSEDISNSHLENSTVLAATQEGSGQFQPDDDINLKDDLDGNDSDTDDYENNGIPIYTSGNHTGNVTIHRNGSFIHPWQSDGKLVLFSLPNLEDNLLLFILIGVGVLLIVVITVISVIVCKNRSVRSGLNRKFDTFQNPIYEKPVIRLPMTNSSESDPSQEKIDLGNLSDSTVLD